METSEVLKEEEPKIIHHVDRVNLYDFGYEKSGSTKGDPDLFASFLGRILNGDLVENQYDGFTDEEKREDEANKGVGYPAHGKPKKSIQGRRRSKKPRKKILTNTERSVANPGEAVKKTKKF